MSIILSEIWTYPIKSCKGMRHKEVDINLLGLSYDRRFVIVDEKG